MFKAGAQPARPDPRRRRADDEDEDDKSTNTGGGGEGLRPENFEPIPVQLDPTGKQPRPPRNPSSRPARHLVAEQPRSEPGARDRPSPPPRPGADSATRSAPEALAAERDPDGKAPRAKARARKVQRVVRHVEPWSVLKLSLLFFLSLFLIVCVASAVLWNAARSAGVIDDTESFITSLGFGNCEQIDVDAPPAEDAVVPEETTSLPDGDGDCGEGQRLVGGFRFEGVRILQAFVLGGIVLVLGGAAAAVVVALLFNLISDLTGGLRITVLEEDPAISGRGSQPASRGD